MANVCGPMSTPWDHPIKIWNGAHIPRNPSKFLACLSKHFSKHGRWGPIYATGFPHWSCSLIRRITHIHILYAFHSGCMTAPRKRQNKLLCHFTEMVSMVREVKWVAQPHTAYILQVRMKPGLLFAGSMFLGIVTRFEIWKESRFLPWELRLAISETL